MNIPFCLHCIVSGFLYHLVVDEIVGRHCSGEEWVLGLAVLTDPLPPLCICVLSPVQERLRLLHHCLRFAPHLAQHWIWTFICNITSVSVCFYFFPIFTILPLWMMTRCSEGGFWFWNCHCIMSLFGNWKWSIAFCCSCIGRVRYGVGMTGCSIQ